ncbi:MAG: TauD/TfdA family dioxygenase [Sciscionella sp.]
MVLEVCVAIPGEVDDPGWVAAAREGWEALPLSLRRAVRQFRRDSGPHGCLLLRGIPLGAADTIPPTPMVAGSVQRTPAAAAAALVMIACGLGDPVAFQAEKSGALVQDVVPVPGREKFQGNAGSVLLSFHNENAFHLHRPDFLMLLCLRADHERVAQLTTACIRTVLPLLSEDAREALFSDEFVTEPPPSFASGGATSPHPVLFGAQDDPDIRVDIAATTPLTPRAKAGLAELDKLFTDTACSCSGKLNPGDLAIVDNRVTVHGRSAFTPRYDGADRWLQRTFVAADLRRSRNHRPQDGYVLTR